MKITIFNLSEVECWETHTHTSRVYLEMCGKVFLKKELLGSTWSHNTHSVHTLSAHTAKTHTYIHTRAYNLARYSSDVTLSHVILNDRSTWPAVRGFCGRTASHTWSHTSARICLLSFRVHTLTCTQEAGTGENTFMKCLGRCITAPYLKMPPPHFHWGREDAVVCVCVWGGGKVVPTSAVYQN